MLTALTTERETGMGGIQARRPTVAYLAVSPSNKRTVAADSPDRPQTDMALSARLLLPGFYGVAGKCETGMRRIRQAWPPENAQRPMLAGLTH